MLWNNQWSIVKIRFELSGKNVEMSNDTVFDPDGKFNPLQMLVQEKRSCVSDLNLWLSDSNSSRQSGELDLNVTDCHLMTLQRLAHFVESVEKIGQAREHHEEFFTVEVDMEIVFVLSQENVSLQPVTLVVRQKNTKFCQFSGPPIFYFSDCRSNLTDCG